MARLFAVAAAVATLTALIAGCTDASPVAPQTTPSPSTSASLDPRLAPACGEAQGMINEATARLTTRLADAVGAGERGDLAARDQAIADIRAVFVDWAAKLRELSGRVDAELSGVLVEYARAAEAVIARVRTSDDLDKLSTFDDQELDTAASRLADVCG